METALQTTVADTVLAWWSFLLSPIINSRITVVLGLASPRMILCRMEVHIPSGLDAIICYLMEKVGCGCRFSACTIWPILLPTTVNMRYFDVCTVKDLSIKDTRLVFTIYDMFILSYSSYQVEAIQTNYR